MTPVEDRHFQQRTSAQRSKRPVRLLPARFWQGERKNNTEQPPIRKFYGPTSNCSDLVLLLGYTLLGRQPNIKSNTSNNIDIPIPETIYCAFKQTEGSLNL